MIESLDHAAQHQLDTLELPSCTWQFPSTASADESGLVAVGGDLAPETLVSAYCHALFPMPLGVRRRIGWWSPDPRAILATGDLRVSRSLRRSRSRYSLSVDRCFADVVTHCADPQRPHGWITSAFIDAYLGLFERGLAHSIEVWDDRGALVGGLYGVSIGALFAGESMFHHATDASKVALVALVELLADSPDVLLDVQWSTPHLRSLGASEISRDDYLRRLSAALAMPAPAFRFT